MGFLSTLGNIAKIAAPIAAAPFTGGASLLGLAGNVGSVLGSQAQGAAQGRQAEMQQLLQQDALRNAQFNAQQNAQMNLGDLDLNRKKFTEDARGGRARQALMPDILLNMQRSTVGGRAPAQGGPMGSIGPAGRQALLEMQKQALAAQLAGDKFEGGQLLTPPALSQMPKASGWEKAGGILGTIGQIAGAFDGMNFGGGNSAAQVAAVPPQGLSFKPYQNLFQG